jgi:hypothetical protein
MSTVVPYIDQLHNRRNNDCGEGCSVMLAGVVRPEIVNYTMLTTLSLRYNANDRGTGPLQLLQMGAYLGVPFVWRTSAAYPYITLVDAMSLPAANRWRSVTRIAHWILRIDDETYHDPYWPDIRGAFKRAPRAVIDAAELAARKYVTRLGLPCRVGLAKPVAIAPPAAGAPPVAITPAALLSAVTPTMTKFKSRGVNLRTRPIALTKDLAPADKTEGELTRIAWIARDAEVDVREVVNGWANVDLANNGRAVATGVALASLLAPVTAPQPEPTPTPTPEPVPTETPLGDFKLGINVLMNTSYARAEAERGGEYFLVMDDFGGAEALKRAHPNAIVQVRRYFPQNFFLSADQVLQGLEGAQHGALVYTGFNEADQGGQDGDELRTRARIDIAVARKIKERNPGAIYAAGTFSMGTPDFTNPETCKIIREEYAPHYNSGLIALDMHLYSPNPEHINKSAEWQWFPRRWEFLFTRCGFDPKVRAIYCSETGLDQGGIGGFPAHGFTQERFRDWAWKYIALQSLPLVVNGKSYQSPIRGGAIFQLGGNGDNRWLGYNIAAFLPTLREFYGLTAAARRQYVDALRRLVAM